MAINNQKWTIVLGKVYPCQIYDIHRCGHQIYEVRIGNTLFRVFNVYDTKEMALKQLKGGQNESTKMLSS